MDELLNAESEYTPQIFQMLARPTNMFTNLQPSDTQTKMQTNDIPKAILEFSRVLITCKSIKIVRYTFSPS
jgi:hypothetical protein